MLFKFESGLDINLKQRIVSYDNQTIEMSSLTFDLLALLVQSSPQVVSIGEIITKVWDAEVSDETVTQRVALLRKALKSAGVADKCIESVRGQGYRWCSLVKETAKARAITSRKFRTSYLVTSGVVLLLGYLAFYRAFIYVDDAKKTVIYSHNSKNQEYLKQAYFYLNKFDEKSNFIAIELFNKAIVFNAKNEFALIGLSKAYSHQISKYNGDSSLGIRAVQYSALATELSPSNSEAWSALGFAYDSIGNIDKAIKYYRTSLKLSSDNKATQSSLAYLLIIKGRLVEALKLNLAAIDGNQQYRHLQTAQILDFMDLSEDAEKWYRYSLTLAPDSIFSASAYANFLIGFSRFDEAQIILDKAINDRVPQSDLWQLKGRISLLQKDYSLAVNYFSEASLMNDNLKNSAWTALALKLSKQESKAQITSLNSIMKNHNPDIRWPSIFLDFAIISYLNDEKSKALKNIETAIHLGFMDTNYLKQLANLIELDKEPKFEKLISSLQVKSATYRENLQEAEWIPIEFWNMFN